MKLKFDVEIMEMDDQFVAVPVGDGAEDFHGILKVNDSAAFILSRLREETTEQAIVEAALAAYAGESAQVEASVQAYVAALRAENLLV